MPHCVPKNAPPTIFSFKHTLIRSMATPNTPGMPISMHNASSKKACRGGLSEICPTMPSCRVTRPKCGMISQNSGHRSTSLTRPHRQPLFFDVKQMQNIPLTSQNSSPVLHPSKSDVLSNQSEKKGDQVAFQGRPRRLSPWEKIPGARSVARKASAAPLKSLPFG
jgi:hypothetical protein